MIPELLHNILETWTRRKNVALNAGYKESSEERSNLYCNPTHIDHGPPHDSWNWYQPEDQSLQFCFLPPWVRCVSTVALFFRFDGITMWYSAHKGSEGTSKVALILVDIYPIIILHENSPNWHLKYDNGEVQVSDDEKKIQNLWIEFDCRSIWVEFAATLRDEMTHPPNCSHSAWSASTSTRCRSTTATDDPPNIGLDQPPVTPAITEEASLNHHPSRRSGRLGVNQKVSALN